MTDRDPLLEPFDVLVGRWSSEAKHRLVDEVVSGDMTVEWLAGGHFLVLRSHNDHELFPPSSGATSSSSSLSSRRSRANGRTT